jgi:hypothetical protein
MANVFLYVEPPGGRRCANIRQQKTRVDWALEIRELLDVRYLDAKRERLVMDNLNTHGTESLYEAFPPEEARRLGRRLEIYHTSKHGSGLNIAEIELIVLTRQCLERRIPDIENLRREGKAWERNRIGKQKGVDWRFTIEHVRIKLRRLYPQIQIE